MGYWPAMYLLMLPLGLIGAVLTLPELITFFVPLVVARWFMDRLPDGLSTLPLPLSAVIIENIGFFLFGSAGTWAYGQYGFGPIIQIASVTGIAGVSFLVLWVAASLFPGFARYFLSYAVSFLWSPVMVQFVFRTQMTTVKKQKLQ